MLESLPTAKRKAGTESGRAAFYPYYAGFSLGFAESALSALGARRETKVLDCWNGTGTTTSAALRNGSQAIGYDLNPAMVVIAKSRLLCTREVSSVPALTKEILKKASRSCDTTQHAEALEEWIAPQAAQHIRGIECAIRSLLIRADESESLLHSAEISSLSDIAAFFYTALFRTARMVIKRFVTSNPTWIKLPSHPSQRMRPSQLSIELVFKEQVEQMRRHIFHDDEGGKCHLPNAPIAISIASSTAQPLRNNSIDIVLSSPPYCTRIDYAIATSIELAVLGSHCADGFGGLRDELMGTSTVPRVAVPIREEWGPTCVNFLSAMKRHPSKASATYYLKNHTRYFDQLYRSITEIARVLRNRGTCFLVVQDSYYKNIHNELPRIVTEMGQSAGLRLSGRRDSACRPCMGSVNPRAQSYQIGAKASESILLMQKN
jgi:DNA modification methylase